MKNKSRLLGITYASVIAAMYVVLTLISYAFGLSSGAVQVRLSEALVTLAYLTPAAIPGLAVGCLISNLLTGAVPADVVLGTLATFIGALGTYALRKLPAPLSPLPPIAANVLAVPLILRYGYGVTAGIPYLMLTVGAGELVSCGIFGLAVLYSAKKLRIFSPRR